MKWFDVLLDLKELFFAPLMNILCLGGVLLILVSFVEFDKTNGLSLHGANNWMMFVAGFILILLALFLQKKEGIRHKLDYKKGVQVRRDELVICIKTGEMQTISTTTQNTAIILPANTNFVDDCASDRRTAMGAFFVEHFPTEISTLPTLIKMLLASQGLVPTEKEQYSPGTTILLPDKFSKPAKILVTASTVYSPEAGLISSPYIICRCVEEILKITSNQRIDTLYMPILGSGHGGVERGTALIMLLLSILHFSKTYHHIRYVNIVIHPKDVASLNQSRELQKSLAL